MEIKNINESPIGLKNENKISMSDFFKRHEIDEWEVSAELELKEEWGE